VIACTKCGFQNVDTDTFCGSCGGFLEWTGEKSAPPPAPEEPELVPGKRSLLSRVQTALALDVYAPGEKVREPAPGPTQGFGSMGGPARPSGPPGSGPPGGGPPGGGPPGGGPPGGGPPRPSGPSGPPGGGPPGGGPPGGGPPGGGPPGGGPPGGGPPNPANPGGGVLGVEPPAVSTGSEDASALVATGATAPPRPPDTAGAEPRTVARTTVSATRGETTIGAPLVAGGIPGALKPGDTGPVKPTTPTPPRKPVRQPPTRKIVPGDLICGACGEGNPPARNFCSRCGTTLRDAAVARRRWWKRFVPHRRRKALEAGARPWKAGDGTTKRRRSGGKLARVYSKLRPLVAGVLLVAGLVVGFTPDLRGRVTSEIGDAKDSLMRRIQPRYTPLQPVSIAATSEAPEQPVANLIDGNTLTSWTAPATDPEPTFVVRFDEPFDLARISVWNGSVDGFKDNARAADLHFVFDTDQSFDLTIKDLPDKQEYAIENGSGVREVEVHVVGTYSSLGSDDLGLTEIEFLFKR
jgi:hypothetical protein